MRVSSDVFSRIFFSERLMIQAKIPSWTPTKTTPWPIEAKQRQFSPPAQARPAGSGLTYGELRRIVLEQLG
jgi:hypothetical protein